MTNFNKKNISANAIFWKVAPYTVVRRVGIVHLVNAVNFVKDIDGDFVECGVYKGGAIMAMIVRLKELGIKKHIYGFDRFEKGMPEASPKDINFKGQLAKGSLGSYGCSINEVRNNIASTEYDMSYIHLVEGNVEDTLDKSDIQKISLLRVDVDFYDATLAVMKQLYPKVVPGGVVVFDDYDCWRGCKEAVDEYFGKVTFTGKVHRGALRSLVKPITE